ncbi:hypothetical protein CLV28_1335 [Sediminihabitans luteus]|uniref:Uncharacterized protein n=1 Tax=Sediminihabitans luteus TaxID=1138585 RepID=A0A2M9CPN9_9CELL|nr:DUF6361 family protein [Sediminihabitans luteus]PJJ73853.1 hypothetical protein CLV28_1335 [Sediminihabitans luteus]GII98237.1 hypothetical protein Slu03_06150 [Sediminihabitans luteus]
MVSSFGWLDVDAVQRQKMLEVVDLFRESGTVDDLGVGTIRDAFSDLLFPGTSVLHTRLRYVLFVPWLMQRAQAKGSPGEMSAEFRRLEFRLITSLLEGGERQGVIGNTARSGLNQLPSAMYWSALGAWGVRDVASVDAYFRRTHDLRALDRRSVRADDPESQGNTSGSGIDPHLPPAPRNLLTSAVLTLEPEEEQYLSDRIAASARGSMLGWLVHHQPTNDPDRVWDIDNLADAPENLRNVVDHAKRYSLAINGGALLYNLLLAEKSEQVERADEYREALDGWRESVAAARTFTGWNRADFWGTVRSGNPNLRPMTATFVDRWLDLVAADDDVASSSEARSLVATREKNIKGGRARLLNQAALDRWNGASGVGRNDFRWLVARSHLRDLYTAREGMKAA